MENLIGNGCVVHLKTLMRELENLEKSNVDYKGRLFISDRAHIVLDLHQTIDGLREEQLKQQGSQIGTTKRGIGPTYSDKMNRIGLRVGDLHDKKLVSTKIKAIVESAKKRFTDLKYDDEEEIKNFTGPYYEKLKDMIVDGVTWINDKYAAKKRIVIEGANAAMLDIDHGTYPYVTSSNPTIGGALTGLGLSANKMGDVVGVVKAYTTRVGDGPFPTECEHGPEKKYWKFVERKWSRIWHNNRKTKKMRLV